MRDNNKKKQNNKKYEDLVSNKILLTITMGFVALITLMFLYKGFNSSSQILITYTVANVLFGICLVATILCGIWLFKNRRSNVDESMNSITSTNSLKVALVFTVSIGLIRFYDPALIKIFYVLVPLYVANYFILKVYPLDLYLISVLGSIGALVTYALAQLLPTPSMALVAIILAFYIAFALFIVINVLRAKMNNGVVKIFKNIYDFPRKANYWLIILTAFVPFAGLGLALLFGTIMLMYTLYILAAFVFACILYYTYKMMDS